MPVSSITDRRLHVQPAEVHNVLSRHMLADGYDIVMDLRKSKGSWVFDARRGRSVLDFFTNFASVPIGYNHPKMDTPEFRDRIATAAINKPANSDIYTTYMAEFVETFARLAVPPSLNKHMFFIEGGALGIENAVKTAFDWKVRKNVRKGAGERGTQIMHLREAFHGRSGYTLSMTNTADPRKTQYFPKFDWPRIDNPKLRFPTDDDVEQREAAAIAQAEHFLAERKDDFASNDRIFDIEDNVFTVSSRINSTWGGNLTDMVRSQRYFEVIDEERLVDNAARVGAYFIGELQRFAGQFPQLVSNVRGRGLMAAFDLPSGEVRDAALKAFMANDVMVLASGHRSARFRPPLNLSIEEAAEGIRRMERALEQLAR